MPASDAYALAVDHLTARYGRRTVLDGLSLRAERARLTVILGPNGAGKTTLVRCCTGLLKPVVGTVRVLGENAGSKPLMSRVGLMPQSTGAWSGVRAGELLRYLAGLYAHPLDVDALISRFGIAAYAKTAYRRLSGGQQQAVNLAGALIGRPEMVFLDEPTAGLDPRARRATWDLLRELRTSGVSVVLTTHAMDEAAELADQVYIVDRGVVTAAGTVPELTRGGRDLESVYLANTGAPGGAGGSSPPESAPIPGRAHDNARSHPGAWGRASGQPGGSARPDGGPAASSQRRAAAARADHPARHLGRSAGLRADGSATLSELAPSVLALAIWSSGFTSVAISTGFERRYGVLERLAATPLGRSGLLAGKSLALILIMIGQLVILGLAAAALGWRPAFTALSAFVALALVLVATTTFACLALLLAGTVAG